MPSRRDFLRTSGQSLATDSDWDGIYISANLFNLPAQLDRFAAAMREIAAGTPQA